MWGSWFSSVGILCAVLFRPMVCGLEKRGSLEEYISSISECGAPDFWGRQFHSVADSQLPYPSRVFLEVPQ